jgi:hypothetical protein
MVLVFVNLAASEVAKMGLALLTPVKTGFGVGAEPSLVRATNALLPSPKLHQDGHPLFWSKNISCKGVENISWLSEICPRRFNPTEVTVLSCATNLSIEPAYTAPSFVASVHAWHSRQKPELHHARRPSHQTRHLSLIPSPNSSNQEATFDSLLRSFLPSHTSWKSVVLSLLLRSSFLAAANYYQDAAFLPPLTQSELSATVSISCCLSRPEPTKTTCFIYTTIYRGCSLVQPTSTLRLRSMSP